MQPCPSKRKEERLGRRKLGKPGWVSGARSPHGSINDSHRLKFRSKEMLQGSTWHPQCSSPFSPFLSFPFHAGSCCWLLGSGTESTASPISHRPPVGQAAGDIFCEWIFPHWSRLCREEREAEHGKEQPRLLTSFFFFCLLRLGQQSMEQAPRTPLQAARRSPCSACSRGKQAIYI